MKQAITIEKIEITKDALIIANGDSYHVHLSYFANNPLHEGQVLDSEEFADYIFEGRLFKCQLDLTKALSRKDMTIKEAYNYLVKHSYPKDIVNKVINIYKDKGILDDERYIQEYLKKSIRRNMGLVRCVYELEQKGFKSSEIEKYLSPRLREEEERKALALAQKTYRLKGNYRNVYYKLSYAGYDEELIQKVLREIGCDIQES